MQFLLVIFLSSTLGRLWPDSFVFSAITTVNSLSYISLGWVHGILISWIGDFTCLWGPLRILEEIKNKQLERYYYFYSDIRRLWLSDCDVDIFNLHKRWIKDNTGRLFLTLISCIRSTFLGIITMLEAQMAACWSWFNSHLNFKCLSLSTRQLAVHCIEMSMQLIWCPISIIHFYFYIVHF